MSSGTVEGPDKLVFESGRFLRVRRVPMAFGQREKLPPDRSRFASSSLLKAMIFSCPSNDNALISRRMSAALTRARLTCRRPASRSMPIWRTGGAHPSTCRTATSTAARGPPRDASPTSLGSPLAPRHSGRAGAGAGHVCLGYRAQHLEGAARTSE